MIEFGMFVFFVVGFFKVGYDIGVTSGYQKGIEDKEDIEQKESNHIRY